MRRWRRNKRDGVGFRQVCGAEMIGIGAIGYDDSECI